MPHRHNPSKKTQNYQIVRRKINNQAPYTTLWLGAILPDSYKTSHGQNRTKPEVMDMDETAQTRVYSALVKLK